jgi:hypothetical protein
MTRHAITLGSAVLGFLALAGCDSSSVEIGGSVPVEYGSADAGCTPPAAVTAEIFASDDNVSPALALTSTTLYWVDRGATISDSIQALPLTGGPVTTLFTASPDPSAAIEDVVTDGTSLYFVQVSTGSDGSYTSRIESVPANGGAAKLLATDDGFDLALTVAGGFVYYTDGTQVQSVATSGGSTTVVSMDGGSALASIGASVFWIDGSGSTYALGGPTSTPSEIVATSAAATDDATLLGTLVTSPNALFWPCQDDTSDLLCSVPQAGSNNVTVVTSVPDVVSQLAASATDLYFVDPGLCGSSLQRVTATGGAPEVIASGFTASSEVTATPHAIALDSTYVYWTAAGQVLRTPK